MLVACVLSIMVMAPLLLGAGSTPPQSSKAFKLLILDSQKGNPYDEVRGSLMTSLAGLGYTEGKNLKTTVMFSGNDLKAGERILKDEVKNDYDVIFVGGTAATIAAKNTLYGNAQRVVFGSPTDPVGIGVIKDFHARPSANFTGVCYPVPVKSRLKFLRRLMPKARTFGMIYVDMPQSKSYNRWIEQLLKSDPEFKDIKFVYRSVPLVTGENGDRAMALQAKKYLAELDAKVDAYVKPCDQMGTRSNFSELVFGTSKKPLIGLVKDDVMANWGATAVLFPSHESIGHQAARMIKLLFEGKQVGDIVPEWPHQYGVAVDLKKAKRFGMEIPVEVLQMAGEHIVR